MVLLILKGDSKSLSIMETEEGLLIVTDIDNSIRYKGEYIYFEKNAHFNGLDGTVMFEYIIKFNKYEVI